MQYSFDQIVNRYHTSSIKYDHPESFGLPDDVLPLWVADMDFPVAPDIQKALHEMADHGIFGYSDNNEEYFDAVHHWFLTHFHWDAKKEWLKKTPGVVFAIGTAIRALTNEGDAILIQRPVYYPFSQMVKANNRTLVNNPLTYENGTYSIDFIDFERKIQENAVKMFILCSPHNPVGRVWTKDELLTMAQICKKHNVIVVADEIHCDFTYSGVTHTLFPTLGEEFLDTLVLCTAPSKTFNLAGLQASNIFIPNKLLRDKFQAELNRMGVIELNRAGLLACQAAYTYGEDWLKELLLYLEGNLDLIRSFLSERLPQIKLVEPQGTYLVWLDCSGLGLSGKELNTFFGQKAKLWLDGGSMFGKEGASFQRINIACPRSILEKALTQLEAAIRTL
ncbi:MAG: pyridoxal phosphate-dependent aminotransferase [Acetatifactor sp.]|nr:pyridoxal phosphate-dependent aminotransferase [Acetatifactor sp.]